MDNIKVSADRTIVMVFFDKRPESYVAALERASALLQREVIRERIGIDRSNGG